MAEDLTPNHSTENPQQEALKSALGEAAEIEIPHYEGITTPEQAEEFLNFVRTLYRRKDVGAIYTGRPSPQQLEERAFMDLEARELLHGFRMFIEAVADQEPKNADERRDYRLGTLEFEDMLQAFSQLYMGMAKITNQLEAENPSYRASGYPKLIEFPDSERSIIATQLFNDFQTLNARRFGAEGIGLNRITRKHTDDGGIEEIKRDKDAATTMQEIMDIASDVTYVVPMNEKGNVMHPAGKVSPDQATELRRTHHRLNRDDFYKLLWGARNAYEKEPK